MLHIVVNSFRCLLLSEHRRQRQNELKSLSAMAVSRSPLVELTTLLRSLSNPLHGVFAASTLAAFCDDAVLCCISEGPSNDEIRTQVVRMYADFVSDVDPRGGLLDWLIQEEVVTLEMKERVVAEPSTSRERCRRLLDALFASSNPRAFVVLRRALIREKKSWLVERIDCAAVTVTVTATPAADAAARPLNDGQHLSLILHTV